MSVKGPKIITGLSWLFLISYHLSHMKTEEMISFKIFILRRICLLLVINVVAPASRHRRWKLTVIKSKRPHDHTIIKAHANIKLTLMLELRTEHKSLIYFVTTCILFSTRTSECTIFVICALFDDAIKWKHYPRYWPFVRGSPLTKASDAEL